MKPRILIVDDDPGTQSSLTHALELEGYAVSSAGSVAEALRQLAAEPVDVVLSDVVMPGADGLELLRELRARDPELPVILMSGQATLEAAVKATRMGALDFVEKPVGLDRLALTLRNALRLDRLQREYRELQRYWQDELQLVGDSPPMRRLRSLIERAAPSDVPVLILGENGTGKELVARAVHELSPRRDKPFVRLNCAALPAELVESELFGHEKGAFSGALERRRGAFEQADGGTLFLDEIGDMPAPMQAKLLRVLHDGGLRRVGGSGELRVDVRLISATNRPLQALLAEGGFREDLYYRISTLSIETPALRERREDIGALARHFLEAACRRNRWRARTLEPAALELLRDEPWRGNVRELKNVIERALILCPGDRIGAVELRVALPASRVPPRGAAPAVGPLRELVEAFEREVIRERLHALGGNAAGAARSLGLERSHLYKKCKQLGIEMREDG